MIVSFPSGHRPGNRACLPPKKQARGNKPSRPAKNKCPFSTERACLRPEKKQMPPAKKKRPQRANPPCRPTPQGPEAAFSTPGRLPIQAPPRKSCLPASRKKNRPRKTNRPGTKKTNLCLFFRACLGRQTNNQIHVPLLCVEGRPLL